jgi:ABC-type multidrug transport system ATPase subunit
VGIVPDWRALLVPHRLGVPEVRGTLRGPVAGRRIDSGSFFDLKGAEGTLCRDLSKGMRQKVMLAAAFIHEPKLLFLDEPFINLDPIYQRKLRDYLLELRDDGRTVFLCSHILDVAQRIVQEMIILDHGKVVLKDKVSNALVGGEDLETLFLRLGGREGTAALLRLCWWWSTACT